MKYNELYYGEKRKVITSKILLEDNISSYLDTTTEYTIKTMDYLILRKISSNKYQDIFSKKKYSTEFSGIGDIFIDEKEGHIIPYMDIENPSIDKKTSLNKIKKELEILREVLPNIFIGYLIEVVSINKENKYKQIKKTLLYKETEHTYIDIETEKKYKDYAFKIGNIIVASKLTPLLEPQEELNNKNIIKTMIKSKKKFNEKEYSKND